MSKTSYILGKRINRGGMAEIYLGKALGEDNFERICAIKRILPHYASDKEYIKMFRDEAHICKRLQHANIVQVYDFSEVEESFALIMEFIDGADLRTLLSTCEALKVKLPLPMAIHIGACAARGLHYAHSKTDEITGKPLEIIHRDISPQNILISYEGEVKVTDFGIASATADNKSTETKAGVVKGKYSYMSPEQLAAKKLDGRSDVFSLSVVLWEILSMRRLFAGATEVETIRKVQECAIPLNLIELNNEVDQKLMDIIHRGLQADRRKRYQTASALDHELSKYLHTKYPDFSASELGDFLKQKLAGRRLETADFIKQTLAISTSIAHAPSHREEKSIDASPEPRTATPMIKLELSSIEKITPPTGIHHRATGMSKLKTGTRRLPGATFGTITSRTNNSNKINTRTFTRKTTIVGTLAKLFFAVGLLMLIGLGTFQFRKKFMKLENAMRVSLKAEPSVVLLTVDNQKINNGAYSNTPVKLRLTPGKHSLIVYHPGYAPYTVDFQGENGDNIMIDQVYLKRKTDPGVAPVKIVSNSLPYQVNVDHGYKKGATPLIADDLTLGEQHEFTFSDNKKTYRCSFRTPATKPQGQTLVVTIKQRLAKSPECRIELE